MRRTVISLIAGAAIGCAVLSCSRYSEGYTMNSIDSVSARLPKSFDDMQSVCFGRFLIDVPRDAEIVYGRQGVGGNLKYYENQAAKVEELISNHLAQLEADRYLIESRKEFLPRYGDVIPGELAGQRIIFGSTDYATHSLTAYIPKSSHLFVLDFLSSMDNAADIETMNRVARHLRLRPANEIPKDTGVCIDGGFVAGDPKYENISIGIRLRDHPDIHFSIATIKHREYLPASSMIEERIRQAESAASPIELLWHNRIKYMRRGPKVLGDWIGEEVAARLPSQEGMRESHQFAFVSLGEVNNPYKPHIDIELVSGVKKNARGSVPPSLSDQQMLLLWDTLINSIRVRPTGPVETKPAKKAALGTTHVTGRICPQTGWWQCDEPGVVAEARRKLIREGELMPRTTVKLERSGWDRLKGRPEQIQRPTVWTLAEYAEEDPNHNDRNG